MSKIVLVTGASRGIGLEAAKHFSKEGYKVIGTSRGDFNLGQLIGDDSAISVQLDLTSKESIKNLILEGPLFVYKKTKDLVRSNLIKLDKEISPQPALIFYGPLAEGYMDHEN